MFELATGDELQRTSEIADVADVGVRSALLSIFGSHGVAPTLPELHERFADSRRRVFRDRTPPLSAEQVRFLAQRRKLVDVTLETASEVDDAIAPEPVVVVDVDLNAAATTAPSARRKRRKRRTSPTRKTTTLADSFLTNGNTVENSKSTAIN